MITCGMFMHSTARLGKIGDRNELAFYLQWLYDGMINFFGWDAVFSHDDCHNVCLR